MLTPYLNRSFSIKETKTDKQASAQGHSWGPASGPHQSPRGCKGIQSEMSRTLPALKHLPACVCFSQKRQSDLRSVKNPRGAKSCTGQSPCSGGCRDWGARRTGTNLTGTAKGGEAHHSQQKGSVRMSVVSPETQSTWFPTYATLEIFHVYLQIQFLCSSPCPTLPGMNYAFWIPEGLTSGKQRGRKIRKFSLPLPALQGHRKLAASLHQRAAQAGSDPVPCQCSFKLRGVHSILHSL